MNTAYFHLPGLFEFYELYRVFLPLFREHREYFYDWCEIGSIYGACVLVLLVILLAAKLVIRHLLK